MPTEAEIFIGFLEDLKTQKSPFGAARKIFGHSYFVTALETYGF